jgi:exopolysaccharide biosynthesis polyprenyl glycosylphosphotransferase
MSIRYSKHLPGFIFIGDLILLNAAIYTAYFVKTSALNFDHVSPLLVVLINLAWLLTSALSGSFKVRRPLVLRENLNRFIMTLIYHLMVVFSVFYFFKLYDFSRSVLVIGYGMFFVFVILYRSIVFFFLDYIRARGYNHRQVIIIGDKFIAERLLTSFSHHPEYGYDLSDFISEDEVNTLPEEEFVNRLLSKNPDEIFLCYTQLNVELLNTLIKVGEQNFIKIKVVSDLMLANANNHAQLVNYHNVPVLQIKSNHEISLKIKLLKRGFDVAFSSGIMLAGAPVFMMLYLITKVTSRGPAFYRQERVGRNEKPFYIYKFRSMRIDAEKYGPQLSSDNDPRITKWGKLMRKTRLDELPQFWNVLKGDMSVVGPRPERQYFIEKIVEKTPNYKKLLRVKPGLTSIGQVHYGYAENVDQMCDRVRYDLLYLQNINLNSDLNIILKTVKVMVQGKGK